MRQAVALVIDTWNFQTRSWGQTQLVSPTWSQIEASIRALDSLTSPILTIILNEAGSPENCLQIQGGNGKYTIHGTTGNGRWVQYFNRSIEEYVTMTIVTADVGLTACAEQICTSTELAVQITRYFSRTTHSSLRPAGR